MTLQDKEEQLRIANDISDSFWAAIKSLNLGSIDVNNPGSHVTAVIAERDKYKVALEWISVAESWDANTLRSKAREALLEDGKS